MLKAFEGFCCIYLVIIHFSVVLLVKKVVTMDGWGWLIFMVAVKIGQSCWTAMFIPPVLVSAAEDIFFPLCCT